MLLVVERAEQLTGSGCCGKLEGDRAFHRGRPLFEEARSHQEAAGPLFRLFLELGPGWRVTIVDPRNLLGLWPALWAHVRRHRPPFPAALRSLLLAFSTPALLVDGRLVTSGGLPRREVLESWVERLTERPLPIAPTGDQWPNSEVPLP